MGQTQTNLLISLVLLMTGVGCMGVATGPVTTTSVSAVESKPITATIAINISPIVITTATIRPTATGTSSPVLPTSTQTPVRTPIPVHTSVITGAFVSQSESNQRPVPDNQAAKRRAVVPILMYHYLSVPPKNADRIRLDLSVAPSNFDAQLRYLATYSYTTVSLYDVYNYLSTGAELPPHPIVLTFDDGYRDAYDNAFPLLKKYGMTATFFIISDFVSSGNPSYMNWDMVAEMSAAGMSIESHTRSHPDMRNRTNDFLIYQILGPIESITAYTGKRPHFFCYPSGRYDDATIRVLSSADTWAALTTQPGYSHMMSDAMTWTRVRLHGTTTLAQFAVLVKPSQPK